MKPVAIIETVRRGKNCSKKLSICYFSVFSLKKRGNRLNFEAQQLASKMYPKLLFCIFGNGMDTFSVGRFSNRLFLN